MRHLALVLTCIGLLFVASPVAAQQEEVRELNARGLEAFSKGEYVEAAELFGRAYALDPQGELLKNQAVAWYKAERCTEAVESAHQFLLRGDVVPDERKEIQGLLGACKVRLAREALDAGSFELAEKLLDDVEAMNPDPVLADRVALVRVEIAKKRSATQAEQAETGTLVVPLDGLEPREQDEVEVDREQDRSSTSGSGWSLVGIGSAMLVGGLVYHIVAATSLQPEFREVAAAGVDRQRYDDLDRSLRTANVLVPTLYGMGAAVATTGIFLVVRKPADSGGDEVVLLGVSGTF